MKIWTWDQLKAARMGDRENYYRAEPEDIETLGRLQELGLDRFLAISIGDGHIGSAFIVPLDESSREVAQMILDAIAAYQPPEDS